MEPIPTMGAYKQQSLIGLILPSNMLANRPSLACVIRSHPNRHSERQPDFVSRLGLPLRKTPSAPLTVGLAAFDGNLLRLSALGSITDSLQPLHTYHRVWLHEYPSLAAHFVYWRHVLGQVPSVSTRIKTTFALGIGFHRDVPAVHVHPLDHGDGGLRVPVQSLFDGHQQLPCPGCRVLPEQGPAQCDAMLPGPAPSTPDAGSILRIGTGCLRPKSLC